MFKQVVVSIFLCACWRIINAEENATIIKEIKLSKPFSTTIVDDSHLLTFSSNMTHIFVNSTNELDKPCEIAIDRVEHPIQKKIKAMMLKNKVIVWGVRAKYHVNQKIRMDYTIMVVDPKQCNYKPVITYEEEYLRFDLTKNLPEIVTHDDSFDVFYSTMRSCTPCRYSIDGKRLDLKHGIDAEPLQYSVSSHVKAFNGPELNDGYFYAHNYDDRKSVMKIYDNAFNIIKQKTLKASIDVAVVSSGDHPNITICHVTSIRANPANNDTVNCERFDINLETVFSVNLPLLKKHDPATISLSVDTSGDSFITVLESDESEEVDVFRLYRLNSSGQISNIFKLSEMPKNRFSGYWLLRGFIFDKLYCIEMTKMSLWSFSLGTENESIKCIAV